MIDPLTAEERVTLNKLNRKIKEHQLDARHNLSGVVVSCFDPHRTYSLPEITHVLALNANLFISALQPYRNNSCSLPTSSAKPSTSSSMSAVRG